jgi:hypothetical protein
LIERAMGSMPVVVALKLGTHSSEVLFAEDH